MFSLLVWAGLNYAWCLSLWPQEYYSYPVCLSGPQWSFSIHSRPALLLIEHFEIWVNVLISWLSPSVGEIVIREFGLIMISFRKRKPHLHDWVSGGILSDWQLVISGLKCLSRSNIRTLFQLFILTLKSQLALDFSVLLSCIFFFFAPCIFFLVHTAQSWPRWLITGPATRITLYNSCLPLHRVLLIWCLVSCPCVIILYHSLISEVWLSDDAPLSLWLASLSCVYQPVPKVLLQNDSLLSDEDIRVSVRTQLTLFNVG